MFESKTLFIVGAGASKEVDMPVGADLTVEISGALGKVNHVPGDLHYVNSVPRAMTRAFNTLVKMPGGIRTDALEAACHRVKVAMPGVVSIDNFIDLHSGDRAIEAVGKLVIAHCILRAESNSRLTFDRGNIHTRLDLSRAASTWYQRLIRLAAEGASASDPSTVLQNLRFIIFNYDRCLEHFLLEALQLLLGVDVKTAAGYVKAVPIFHPYGTVGILPDLEGGVRVEYGADPDSRPIDLVSISEGLLTFTERVDDKGAGDIRKAVQDAETIVFLGFGFNKQNMELLSPPDYSNAKRVFATGLGMSASDTSVVRSQIHEALKVRISLAEIVVEDMTCCQLFDAYSRSLPAGC